MHNNLAILIRHCSFGSLLMAAILSFLVACSEPDKSPVERAVDEIGKGFENAADELEPNKSPLEELGETVENVGKSIQDSAK